MPSYFVPYVFLPFLMWVSLLVANALAVWRSNHIKYRAMYSDLLRTIFFLGFIFTLIATVVSFTHLIGAFITG